jgi:hypothetical protein
MNCLWTRAQLRSVRWCRRAIKRQSGVDVRVDFERSISFLNDCYALTIGDGRWISIAPSQVLPLVRLLAHIVSATSGQMIREMKAVLRST